MLGVLIIATLDGCFEVEQACTEMCQSVGYTIGTAGGHPLLNCSCSGDGDGLTQEQCDNFCIEHFGGDWPHGAIATPHECICGADNG